MKWIIVNLCIMVICFVQSINCDCCKRTHIYFHTHGECSEFGAEPLLYLCQISACNDGLSHDGNYCGRGSCNIFGCNCDNGCYGDQHTNAVDAFKHRYGSRVFDVKKGWCAYDWINNVRRNERKLRINSVKISTWWRSKE